MTDSHGDQQSLSDLSYPFSVIFTSLAKDEYTLDTYIVDSNGAIEVGSENHDQATNIGIGDIYVAIGDSVTEGYDGTAYDVPPYTDWTQAPIASNDNRNYPQCGISSGFYQDHWQEVSHHIIINNTLEAYEGYPVFLLNEGFAGITSAGYISEMATSNWQTPVAGLHPNKWLLHLGINDGGGSLAFQSNMQTIIDTLKTTYGATGPDITLAVPSTKNNWQPYISNLITSNALNAGPDFNTFYKDHSGDSPTLYSGVHPTAAGHLQMGRLWSLSLMSPKNVSASETSPSSVRLAWDDLSTVEPTIAGYKVYYGTDPSALSSVVNVGSDLQTTINSLTSGQTYYFAVQAYDDDPFVANVSATSSMVSLELAVDSPAHTTVANGPIFTGPASALPGYIAPRPQIDYPDGTVVYLDATTTGAAIIPRGAASTLSNATTTAYRFTRDLEQGVTGDDVLQLQQYLNTHGFPLATSGPGSPDRETNYFGTLTFNALMKFQEAHAAVILAPLNLTQGTGYFGSSTRAFVNANY